MKHEKETWQRKCVLEHLSGLNMESAGAIWLISLGADSKEPYVRTTRIHVLMGFSDCSVAWSMTCACFILRAIACVCFLEDSSRICRHRFFPVCFGDTPLWNKFADFLEFNIRNHPSDCDAFKTSGSCRVCWNRQCFISLNRWAWKLQYISVPVLRLLHGMLDIKGRLLPEFLKGSKASLKRKLQDYTRGNQLSLDLLR